MTTEPRQSQSPSPFAQADALSGRTIGRCLLQTRLGQGGMGTVYLARHLTLNKPVAVKILRSDLPTDIHGVERFLREARAAARLEHNRIVQIYDAGHQDTTYYIVMQYVIGESMATRLRREKRLPIPEALRIFRAIAEGIGYAHGNGIVHRDIKPDNILLGDDGSVKITDFGLACMNEGDPTLSTSRLIMGSPVFMSPEQAQGLRIDHRTDIYSLGATLYQMVTGVAPFQGTSSLAIVCKVVKEPLRPPHEVFPQLPLPLSRLIQRLMEKDRDKRVETIQEVQSQLGQLGLDLESPVAKKKRRLPRSWLVNTGLVALVLVLVACGYFGGKLINWRSSPGMQVEAKEKAAPQGPGKTGAVPPTHDTKGSADPDEEAFEEPADEGVRRPLGAMERLAPGEEKALRERYEALQRIVVEQKLDDLKDFIDPVFLERSPYYRQKRPIILAQRILTDSDYIHLAQSVARSAVWENRSRGLAILQVQVPGEEPIYRLSWIQRGEKWYIQPPRAGRRRQ